MYFNITIRAKLVMQWHNSVSNDLVFSQFRNETDSHSKSRSECKNTAGRKNCGLADFYCHDLVWPDEKQCFDIRLFIIQNL